MLKSEEAGTRIDANVYLGHWPFRRLPAAGPKALRELCRRTGADRALAGNLNGAFYRDPRDANEEAWDAIKDDPFFSYTPAVNPSIPGWETDIRWALDRSCPAVRVFPGYWGIRIPDPPAARLLAAVSDAGLGLVVNVRLHDERLHHPRVPVPAVPGEELEWLVRQWPQLPILLVAAGWNEVQAIGRSAIRDSRSVVEISYMKNPTFVVEDLVEGVGSDHVAFGSGIPLHYADASAFRVEMAEIGEAEREAVWGGTIASAFGLSAAAGER